MDFENKEYFKPGEKYDRKTYSKDFPNIIKEIKHKKDTDIESRITDEVKQSFENEEDKLNKEL